MKKISALGWMHGDRSALVERAPGGWRIRMFRWESQPDGSKACREIKTEQETFREEAKRAARDWCTSVLT